MTILLMRCAEYKKAVCNSNEKPDGWTHRSADCSTDRGRSACAELAATADASQRATYQPERYDTGLGHRAGVVEGRLEEVDPDIGAFDS